MFELLNVSLDTIKYQLKPAKVSELNECSPTKTSPKLKEIIQSHLNTVENKLDFLFNRILAEFITIEYEKKDIEIEKKKKKKKKEGSKKMKNFPNFSFPATVS